MFKKRPYIQIFNNDEFIKKNLQVLSFNIFIREINAIKMKNEMK